VTTKFLQKGEYLEYSNSGSAISSNDVVLIGRRVGIALDDIAATTGKGTVALVGVFENMAAVNNSAFVQGDNLYWDPAASKFTNLYATGCIPAGWAWAAKAETTPTCTICLDPSGQLGLPPGGTSGQILKVGTNGGYDIAYGADAVE
jgi:predicted RecA/RadA family phage recombinase